MIDYDNLPDHPVDLWTVMELHDSSLIDYKLLHGASLIDYKLLHGATISPTNGVQSGKAVWVVLVPGADLAYKVLLDIPSLMTLAKVAMVTVETLGRDK
jgi:hypothetical protein